MSLDKLILKNPLVPWRIRHPLEQWIETTGRERFPGFYRFTHFGRFGDKVQPITRGPRHHFFGYYEKSPWNASQRSILAHEASFNDRTPRKEDRLALGVVELDNGNRFLPFAQTGAWNWQQGAMLQWLPPDADNLILYNDRRDERFCGVLWDVRQALEKTLYDRPIYAVTPDGKTGFSLNFARLAVHRPGYGYEGVEDPWKDDRHPDADGIFRIDLATGTADQIVSTAQLAQREPKPSMQGAWHYVNHIQVSPSGKRLAFFHIWHHTSDQWEVRLYTCRPDGSDLRCLLDTGTVSHYDWRDDDHILIWARKPGIGERFLLCNVSHGSNQVFGEGILTVDGHCSYSPDRKWILNDTYPDTYKMRTLMLVRDADGQRIDLARLHSPKDRWWGEIRCDLHPRWNRDGTQVCIDSVHSGQRQMYIVDVSEYLQ